MARAKPPQERRILCTGCGGLLIVAAEAKSVSCRHCHGRVICERMEVKDFVAVRRFRTANLMHIHRKGRVHASIWAEELWVDGALLGDAAALGVIRVRAKAVVTGALRATTLEVESGATLVGEMRIGPEYVPEREVLSQTLPGDVIDEVERRKGGQAPSPPPPRTETGPGAA